MRTNIEIDDRLMADAMAASGLRTKREVVEDALRKLVEAQRQSDALDQLRGLDPDWEGDLDAWRRAR